MSIVSIYFLYFVKSVLLGSLYVIIGPRNKLHKCNISYGLLIIGVPLNNNILHFFAFIIYSYNGADNLLLFDTVLIKVCASSITTKLSLNAESNTLNSFNFKVSINNKLFDLITLIIVSILTLSFSCISLVSSPLTKLGNKTYFFFIFLSV